MSKEDKRVPQQTSFLSSTVFTDYGTVSVSPDTPDRELADQKLPSETSQVYANRAQREEVHSEPEVRVAARGTYLD